MKILFPITKFYPHSGGGPSFTVYWLAKELAKNGHNVTVVATNKGLNNLFLSDCWNNLDGIRVKYCSYRLEKFPLKMIYNSIKEVKSSDIIQLSSVSSLAAFFVALSSIVFKKAVIWSPRGEFAEAAVKNNVFKNIYFSLIKYLFKHFVVFHSTSDKETAEIKATIGKCNIIEVPNFIELPQKMDGETERTLLYVGRINPIKSLDKLIKSLSLSDNFRKSDYVLKIAGDFNNPSTLEYVHFLEKLIDSLGLSNRVIFLGVVKDKEKFALYSRAYFSFLVSESENFGNVVIESLSQGTPVVASLGTPWELLNSKGIGYHVSNDPQVLSKVINDIIELPYEKYLSMRSKAYDICCSYFSIEKNVYKWIDIYKKYIR